MDIKSLVYRMIRNFNEYFLRNSTSIVVNIKMMSRVITYICNRLSVICFPVIWTSKPKKLKKNISTFRRSCSTLITGAVNVDLNYIEHIDVTTPLINKKLVHSMYFIFTSNRITVS